MKFVTGNHSSFEEVFKTYHDGLFGYGMKLCSRPELVEDCIQNLFVNIWERRNELTHITSPNVYLYVSLRRNLLKLIRKSRIEREYTGLEQDELNIIFGAEEIIIKSELRKQQRDELRKALNQLSNQQKEVLYLHYYNGMSYGEIEEILSISRQSVRNHMYRAIQSLRLVLDIEVMRLVVSLLFGVFIFV